MQKAKSRLLRKSKTNFILVSLNNYFDHIYCINLSRRQDRKQRCKNIFKKHQIDAEFFDAIDGSTIETKQFKYDAHAKPYFSVGMIGCTHSFIKVFEDAKQKKYQTILVLEDDVEFVENFNKLFKEYFEQIPNNWTMLYTSGNHRGEQYIQQTTENIYRIKNTLTAHFLGLKYEILDELIKETSKFTMPNDWHFAEVQKRTNAYCMVPHLTWQREGFSDNEQKEMNYDKFIKQFNIRNDFNIRK